MAENIIERSCGRSGRTNLKGLRSPVVFGSSPSPHGIAIGRTTKPRRSTLIDEGHSSATQLAAETRTRKGARRPCAQPRTPAFFSQRGDEVGTEFRLKFDS